MARSSYIYIVDPGDGPSDVEAFTVKHEAQTWITQTLRGGWINDSAKVVRVPDGGPSYHRERKTWTLQEFLDER